MKTTPLLLAAFSCLPAASFLHAGCPPTPTSYCLTLPPGYTAFANHLEQAQLSTLLGTPAPSTTVFRFLQQGYSSSVFDPDIGGWDDDAWIDHGEGILIYNPSPIPGSMTVVGAQVDPVLPLNLRPGFNLVGLQEVGMGTFESIAGYPPGGCPGMHLFRLDPTLATRPDALNIVPFIDYSHNGLTWSPAPPVINVGEAVFIYVPTNCVGTLSFSVSGVFPATVGDCSPARIQVIGSALGPGTTVKFRKTGQADITATNITSQPGGFSLDALFDLAGALPGAWDIEVRNPSNAVQTLAGALHIVTTPSLTAALPSSAAQCNSAFNLTALGSALCPGALLKLARAGETDRPGSAVAVDSYSGRISATFDLLGAAVGTWDLVVVNPGGGSNRLGGGFSVRGPALLALAPNRGGMCAALSLTARVSGVCSVSAFKLVRAGHSDRVGSGVSWNGVDAVTATFDLTGAPVGSVWDVVLTVQSGQSLTLPGAFSIQPPQIFGVAQNSLGTCVAAPLVVRGEGICPGASVRLVRAGQSDIVGSSPFVNATQSELSALFDLTQALAGSWDVVIQDGGGGITTLPGALAVVPLALGHTVTTVVPDRGGNCGRMELNIGGTGLPFPMAIKLARTGQVDIVGIPTGYGGHLGLSAAALFDLSGAAPGSWDLVVIDPACGAVTLPGAFTVAPMALRRISPLFGRNCTNVAIDVYGSCFAPGAIVKLKKAGSATLTGASTTLNPGRINAAFTLTNAMPGLWDVEVTHPNGDIQTAAGAFTVLPCTDCDVGVTLNSPSRISAGREENFSVCYVNHGATALHGVAISVTGIPADAVIALVTASPAAVISSPVGQPQTISFTVPSLDAGQGTCFYFRLTIPTIRPAIALTGRVTGPCVNVDMVPCEVLASGDPNTKTGLAGQGVNHYVTGAETLPYAIHFVNMAEATAPAQEIIITDHVDPAKLDLATFSLGTVTFGATSVTAPAGLSVWAIYLRHDVDGILGSFADDILVKIEGALVIDANDANYGRITWALRSIDPATGLRPSDPLRGFLPPNLIPPEGEGSVTYDIRPRVGLVTQEIIGNNASITFDVNPPILTPIWLNVMDKEAPQSSVTTLAPVQNAATFPVDWSGTDAGSGIASYDLFVSDNGGAFSPWLSGTSATSGTYTGLPCHTYRFYSVATDQVGHTETVPGAPDASTRVGPVTDLVVTCPSDFNTNSCGNSVVVNFPDPVVTGGALESCAPASGSSFVPGATPVLCQATNACATNFCTFVVTVQSLTPVALEAGPQSQESCGGEPAVFSVAVSGTPPFFYQWRRNGADLPGANAATHTIPAVQFADAGSYLVFVSNACGTVLSASAALTVTPPSTLTLSNPRSDCVHGRFYVRLNRTFALPIVRDPAHYLIRWQNGASNGALPVVSVQSTVVAGPATDVTLVPGGLLPPETAAYTLEVRGLPGDCDLAMPPVTIAAPCDPILRGRVFRDDPTLFQNDVCTQSAELDNNSLFDEVRREYGLPGHVVVAQNTVNPGLLTPAVTDAKGNFRLSVPPGNYSVRLAPSPNWVQACPELDGAYPVNATRPGVDGLNFSRRPLTGFRDLRVSVNGFAARADRTPDTRRTPCCGQDAVFLIDYRNSGTLPVNDGMISLSLPPALIPAAPASALLKPKGEVASAAVGVGSDAWSWYLPTVIPGGSGQLQVRVRLNCPENSLIELAAVAAVSQYPEDPTPGNNLATRSVFTRCALDDSGLTVSPTGCGPTGLIPGGTELLYTISFQNIGTGPALDVVLEDALPPALDPSTMEMVNWSHDFVLSTTGNTLQWSMPDIALPSEESNSAESLGFVTFKIRPTVNAAIGLPIRNSASIHLDLNPPMLTARTTNTLSNAALPVATFLASAGAVRPGQPVDFSYTGGTAGASFLWEFGPDANPPTSTTAHPAGILFANPGRRTIKLTVGLGDCVSSAAQALLVAEPRITITRRGAPPGQARLLWPLPDFRLQGTGELPQIQWLDLPGASGVLVPALETEKLYRLINP